MGKEKPKCEQCGRVYKPCRHNAHRQKWCRHKDCILERDRERKRLWYRGHYKKDETFRKAETQRCRKGQRQRRSAAVKKAQLPAAPLLCVKPYFPDLALMAVGLVGQWIGSDDPAEVLESARALERRGQLLALTGAPARGSPGGK